MNVQANELRIGNLVYCWNPSTGSHNETVISINWKHIRNRVEQPEDTTYEPIPLTEEWLVKFGFEKGTDLFEEYAEYEKQFDKGKSITISHKFECYQGIYSQEIKSVHQLQNLYFALTGNELTIKDNGS